MVFWARGARRTRIPAAPALVPAEGAGRPRALPPSPWHRPGPRPAIQGPPARGPCSRPPWHRSGPRPASRDTPPEACPAGAPPPCVGPASLPGCGGGRLPLPGFSFLSLPFIILAPLSSLNHISVTHPLFNPLYQCFFGHLIGARLIQENNLLLYHLGTTDLLIFCGITRRSLEKPKACGSVH